MNVRNNRTTENSAVLRKNRWNSVTAVCLRMSNSRGPVLPSGQQIWKYSRAKPELTMETLSFASYRVAPKSKLIPYDQKSYQILLKPVNEIRFIRQIYSYKSCTIILFFGIIYSIRDLLFDIQIAICVRYGKWFQRFLWHQLALESCEFHSKTIFFG